MNTLVIDCETSSLNPYTGELQLIGFQFDDFPIEIVNKENENEFKKMLLRDSIIKIGHNLNFDLLFLNLNGHKTVPPYFCTQTYFHIQNPYESSKLKDIGETVLKRKVHRLDDIITNKEKKGYIKIGCSNTKGYGYVEPTRLAEYLKQDVELTQALYSLIKASGVSEYYQRIEQPLISAILEMELRGLKIDIKKLDILNEELVKEIKELEKYFESKKINPRSPKQIREFIK